MVVLVEVIAKLTRPFPVTNEVTSTLVQTPALNGWIDDPIMLPDAGALLAVMVVSPHVLSVTPRTSYLMLDALLVKTSRVALVIVPLTPVTSNRK